MFSFYVLCNPICSKKLRRFRLQVWITNVTGQEENSNWTNHLFYRCVLFLPSLSLTYLVTEICGPKYRTWFGILTQFPFGIGAAILPLIAYFVRQWVTLQIVIAVPSVLLVLYYWWEKLKVQTFLFAQLIYWQGCKSSFSNELHSVHQFIMVHELQFSSSSS